MGFVDRGSLALVSSMRYREGRLQSLSVKIRRAGRRKAYRHEVLDEDVRTERRRGAIPPL